MTEKLHVVCPRCHATNRVLAGRLGPGASCGACKSPLFDGRPAELGPSAFERHVAGSDVPVVVDFWAPWCAPCRMMAPEFERAAGMLEGVRFAKLNTEEAPELAGRHGIRSIPTMAIFRRGRELARTSGAMPAAQIAQWVRSHAGE